MCPEDVGARSRRSFDQRRRERDAVGIAHRGISGEIANRQRHFVGSIARQHPLDVGDGICGTGGVGADVEDQLDRFRASLIVVVVVGLPPSPRGRVGTAGPIVARAAGSTVVEALANMRHEIVEIEWFLEDVEAVHVWRIWMRGHDQCRRRVEQPFTLRLPKQPSAGAIRQRIVGENKIERLLPQSFNPARRSHTRSWNSPPSRAAWKKVANIRHRPRRSICSRRRRRASCRLESTRRWNCQRQRATDPSYALLAGLPLPRLRAISLPNIAFLVTRLICGTHATSAEAGRHRCIGTVRAVSRACITGWQTGGHVGFCASTSSAVSFLTFSPPGSMLSRYGCCS